MRSFALLARGLCFTSAKAGLQSFYFAFVRSLKVTENIFNDSILEAMECDNPNAATSFQRSNALGIASRIFVSSSLTAIRIA